MRRQASQPDAQSYSKSFHKPSRAKRRLVETRNPASALSTKSMLRNPANKLWTDVTKREVYIEHLTNWASHHDSSPHFHGSISIHPQGTVFGETLELGESVSCILRSAGLSKKIVVRLFQSQQQHVQEKGMALAEGGTVSHNHIGYDVILKRRSRSIQPYQLVIRSGSGWVPAREYLERHYFAHLTRSTAAQESSCTSSPINNINANISNVQVNTQRPAWMSLVVNNVSLNSPDFEPRQNVSSKQCDQNHTSRRTCSKRFASLGSAQETIAISPLFRPFLRLPTELQDIILCHAVGYTRSIRSTDWISTSHSEPKCKPPTTISKLFQLSRAINERMTVYIFRSANFHFGITGFTKFLWQLGPINRSRLQHLTLHYGQGSLLHCIRWLAPDPVYMLLEPPISTKPPNLTYFWRCQLQDLVKELNLLTLTIDITDVPPADIDMIVRILGNVIGSIQRVRIIDYRSRNGFLVEDYARYVTSHDTGSSQPTWRDLSKRYYCDYRRQKWHMRADWQYSSVDLPEVFDRCMDKDTAFFDS